MLKLVNNDGAEIMRLHDNNTEEYANKKIEEQAKKAIQKQEQKDGE